MHITPANYQRLIAINSEDFNCCFYCGCVATEYDLAPPTSIRNVIQPHSDNLEIPACRECHQLLKHEPSGLLGRRIDVVKDKLAKKYARAISVYQMWDASELNELEHRLQQSVAAGLKLGEEATQRLSYKGFVYEVNGHRFDSPHSPVEVHCVAGTQFTDFKSALNHTSSSYRIPKAKLKMLLKEHNNNFDQVISLYQQQVLAALAEKEMKTKCKSLAQQYKFDAAFIRRSVNHYMAEDEEMSLEQALRKLEVERLMGK
ncbi:hypothetical protein [Echinimonas agarilytica]|uniref:Uncharacterized protein n=1 Tax=Echinimonas agarilytica TaxID=1215918 RepID=A0AA41WBT1_9GAMM|nr:hypothetical protein [Echinimonas agarilytica]MCM2681164.1 hypothetical protein [Echinimonas agarilytica]